jgi:hypothetical protein
MIIQLLENFKDFFSLSENMGEVVFIFSLIRPFKEMGERGRERTLRERKEKQTERERMCVCVDRCKNNLG